ncbi:hypothetical protein HJFPF1_10117 [Paramyrothecium foliicola]|nr:hypothetical protein HJFPF1_10117 [Paramyrothecium foliicola]
MENESLAVFRITVCWPSNGSITKGYDFTLRLDRLQLCAVQIGIHPSNGNQCIDTQCKKLWK